MRVRVIVAALAMSWSGLALSAPDPNARVLYMRQDCSVLPSQSQRDACFGDLTQVSDWLANRMPVNRQVLVDVGPGTFFGRYICFDTALVPGSSDLGHVVFKGAGRDQSTLRPDPAQELLVLSYGCTGVEFHDLALKGVDPGGAVIDVTGGSTRWVNLDVRGFWYEEAGCVPQQGTHVWVDSDIVGVSVNAEAPGGVVRGAYTADCDRTEFYGGSISAPRVTASEDVQIAVAVSVNDKALFTGYGTTIRATDIEGAPGGGTARNVINGLGTIGVLLDTLGRNGTPRPGGQFELYGGVIDVKGSAPASGVTGNAVGIYAFNAGRAEARNTEFKLTAGSGATAFRIAGPGTFEPQYFWGVCTVPPPYRSLDGQDAYVESDCAANGSCDSGAQSHFMVYKETAPCSPSNPWRDQVTGQCRIGSVNAATESCWLDSDADGVVNADDSCATFANPVSVRQSFQTTTGGQLDDDADGFGNACDADFDQNGVVSQVDKAQIQASLGKLRTGSNCGSAGNLRCAIFDLDGVGSVITGADVSRAQALLGLAPGPRGIRPRGMCQGPGC